MRRGHRKVRGRAIGEGSRAVYERAQTRIGERETAAHEVQVLGNGTLEYLRHIEVGCSEQDLGAVNHGDCGEE